MRVFFFIFLMLSFVDAQNDKFIPAPTQTNTTQAQTPQKISIKDATMKVINEIRAHNQMCAKATTPLKWSEFLYNEAKEHSIDMAVNNFVGHDGSGKREDLTAQRLQLNRPSHFYERVNQAKDSRKILSGELVIAVGNDRIKTPKTLFDYWMKRNEYCKVLMDPRFKSIALSKVVNKNTHKAYWTLLLAGEELK